MNLWVGIRTAIRRYFLVGLIVLLPFAITIKFLLFIVDYFDSVLPSQPLFGIHIPGLGILLTVLLIFLVGILSRNFFGRTLIGWGDRTILRIPLLRLVYKVVKEVTQTYSKRDRKQFSKVVLIDYPRPGIRSLAFVTGDAPAEIERKTGERMLNLFLPTTPNPTSGFYLMIPASEARELDMTVEEAFKLVISGGMVSPDA